MIDEQPIEGSSLCRGYSLGSHVEEGGVGEGEGEEVVEAQLELTGILADSLRGRTTPHPSVSRPDTRKAHRYTADIHVTYFLELISLSSSIFFR